MLGSDAQGGFVITNPTVSRRHALIRRQADGRGWEILDLHSTNGTFVNGQRIDSCVPIAAGDRIVLGAVAIEIRGLEQPTAAFKRAEHGGRRWAARAGTRLAAAFALSVLGALAYLEFWRSPPGNQRPASSPALMPPAIFPSPPLPRYHPSPAPPAARASRYALPPAPLPSAAIHAGAHGAPAPWLERINFFRGLAKLNPLIDNSALSQGDFDHARYLVKNFAVQIAGNGELGALMHTESPDKPYYTPQGLKAAQNSDVEQWYDPDPAALRRKINPVDEWIRGPFHRLSILDPTMVQAGYGVYCENGICASALELPHQWSAPFASPAPVMFPPPGTVMPFSRAVSGEWPDPLASCAGYRLPAGLPVTLQLGMFVPTNLSAQALALNGAPVEHCAFDAASYTNPNAADQDWARKVLAAYSAIVLIPRAPLRPGERYEVSITARGQRYNWSFKVSASARR